MLERFNMSKAKLVTTPLAGQSALSTNQCPTNEKDKEEMKKVPYASAVGSLMYGVHKARHLSCSWRGQSVSL